MLPLLIPVIIAAVAGVAAIILTILNWGRIVDWFRGRQRLKQSDKDNIALTLQQKLASGRYKTIQGIFNKRTNELLDSEVTEAEEIDEQVAEAHRGEELVVYE